MRFREYPLLNTPNMVVIILRSRGGGPGDARRTAPPGCRRCSTAPTSIRRSAREDVASRLEMLIRYLTEARLLAARPDDRFDTHRARPGGARRASGGLRHRRSDGLSRSSPATSAAWSCAAPAGPACRRLRPGVLCLLGRRDAGRQSVSRPTAPTTSPGRTAGRRRSTRTSAGPGRASRASPRPAPLHRQQPPPAAAASASPDRPRPRPARAATPRAEDHRHAVMHRRHVAVRGAGDGGEARHLDPARRLPEVPDRGEGHDRDRRRRIAQRVLRRRSPVHSYQPLAGSSARRRPA